jgi:hypothetical protein
MVVTLRVKSSSSPCRTVRYEFSKTEQRVEDWGIRIVLPDERNWTTTTGFFIFLLLLLLLLAKQLRLTGYGERVTESASHPDCRLSMVVVIFFTTEKSPSQERRPKGGRYAEYTAVEVLGWRVIEEKVFVLRLREPSSFPFANPW